MKLSYLFRPLQNPCGVSTAGDIKAFAELFEIEKVKFEASPSYREQIPLGNVKPSTCAHGARIFIRTWVLEEMHDRISARVLKKRNLQKYRTGGLANLVERLTLEEAAMQGVCLGNPAESPYGPTAGYLIEEWMKSGLSFFDSCHRLLDWAVAPPKSVSDLRKLESSSDPHPLAGFFDQGAIFKATKDLDKPWVAKVGGSLWELALNDFPEEFLFTLVIDGSPAGTLNDLPKSWERPGPKPKSTATIAAGSSITSSMAASIDSATWLGRYKDGNCKAVWEEIRALGDQVSLPPHSGNLALVVDLFVSRSTQNLQLLIERLSILGFKFLGDDQVTEPPWQRPKPEGLTWLQEYSSEGSAPPAVLQEWYRQVGAVSFIGSHDVLCPICDDPFASGKYADPMQILPFESTCVPESGVVPFSFSKQLKALKAEPDGGYEMRLPQQGGDCWVSRADKATGGMWFSDYVRNCFQWGGFPGWAVYKKRSKRLEETLAKLTAGLLDV